MCIRKNGNKFETQKETDEVRKENVPREGSANVEQGLLKSNASEIPSVEDSRISKFMVSLLYLKYM